MEISFTLNTTEQIFTKWLEERAKRLETAPRDGVSITGDKALHLMYPTWGFPFLGHQSDSFVVVGNYNTFKPDGEIKSIDTVSRPFIAFDFKSLSSERIDVIMSIDETEPLVIAYAAALLELIEKKYPETQGEGP